MGRYQSNIYIHVGQQQNTRESKKGIGRSKLWCKFTQYNSDFLLLPCLLILLAFQVENLFSSNRSYTEKHCGFGSTLTPKNRILPLGGNLLYSHFGNHRPNGSDHPCFSLKSRQVQCFPEIHLSGFTTVALSRRLVWGNFPPNVCGAPVT